MESAPSAISRVHRVKFARLLLLVWAGAGAVNAAGSADSMPAGYSLRDEDVSPDKRFGVIHADVRTIDPAKARNFLVSLQPFRILGENFGAAYFDEGGSRSMSVEWSDDGTVALVLVGGKWGTIGATLFVLKDGQLKSRRDLFAEVAGALNAKFPKGKIRRYNDGLPFVIADEDQWKLSPDGRHVSIAVGVDTAPNLAPGLAWRGTLTGRWSVNGGKWLEKKVAGKAHENPR